MSKKSLPEFLQFLSQNNEALEKVKSLDSNTRAIAAYAMEQGYEFAEHELTGFQNKSLALLKKSIRRKLDDQEKEVDRPGVKQLKELLKLGETNQDVAKQLEEIGSLDTQALIDYGREKGFMFDHNDMNAFAKEIVEQSDELSDEELEMAAGGTAIVSGVLLLVGAGVVFAAAGAAVTAAAVSAAAAAAVLVVKLLTK